MVLNHLLGLYTHPKQEWKAIGEKHEAINSSLSHVLIISAIPALCSYFANSYIGWNIGVGEPILLSEGGALFFALATYIGLVCGVFALAQSVRWMGDTFDSKPSLAQSLELSAYAATPLYMAGIVALSAHLWLFVGVALVGLCYSVYLLFTGLPILLELPEEKGYIYSFSMVTLALVMFVATMAASVILLSSGWLPISI